LGLPSDALIERVLGCRLGVGVEVTRPGIGRDPGWCRRLAEVDEAVAYRGRIGDEGDDAHLGAPQRTPEREHFVDAAEQQRPGRLFQQGALFSSLSVAQNIMLPLREHTALPAPDQERIAAMKLELAGMSPETGLKFPPDLSGGMVKRAAFARALALDPQILFLDEPTSDLDPLTAGGIDAMIRKLNDGLGVTVVIVTHDLTTLFTLCDRVAILVEGKLTVDTLQRLLHNREPWIREFVHGPRAAGALAARRRESHGN
jgi:ABC-type transporter Mla maintaining outer membrane lipid asymmetry ATPase subunit MlaF